jgi:DNA-binding NarL/FixJ family response regulator
VNAGKVTVAIADDHTLFRAGVHELLAVDPHLDVVGEAGHGKGAIALCVQHQPDVLLLDVEMPGPGAADVLGQLRRLCPHTQVIVLTMHDDPEMVHELLDCGATGYLLKSISRAELVAAVESVAGEPATVRLLVSRQTVERLDRHGHGARSGPLTGREVEVLRLTAEALSNAQIASRLHITEATVKRHLTNIYGKLNAVSRVDAVRKAGDAGLIGNGRRRLAG